jgi:hypothetical protein
MTPKEKAQQLVNDFYYSEEEAAKQFALIAVNEIINNINQILINNTVLYNKQLMYWLNVRIEIENL